MPRHDYDIADGTGAAVLADINAVLDAINSTNRDTGTPTSAVVGTMFIDGNVLKVKHGTNTTDITTIGDIRAANLGLLSGSGATMTGRLQLDRTSQSASAPALDFGTTNTGIYKEPSTDSVDITITGTRRASFNIYGLALNSTKFLQFAHTDGTLNLKQVVPSSGAGDKTINIPHQNIKKHYRKSDLFILPAKNEPASISIIESLGFGLPVICSDSCGTKTYIRNGKNGSIFTSGDSNDLHLKIKTYFEDSSLLIKQKKWIKKNIN